MFEFHKDTDRYFSLTYATSKEYIVPFVEKYTTLPNNAAILEVGAGHGATMHAFLEKGHRVTGVEPSESMDTAQEKLPTLHPESQFTLRRQSIYDPELQEAFAGQFDLIVLKDSIEHIPNQQKLLQLLRTFLRPKGYIFIGFPPWHMPYGGHQQYAQDFWISHTPYIHLLPQKLYYWLSKKRGENEWFLNRIEEIESTGISLGEVERYLRQADCTIVKRELYALNPIYKQKFNWPVLKQLPLIGSIPFFRDFYTSCGYYVAQANS